MSSRIRKRVRSQVYRHSAPYHNTIILEILIILFVHFVKQLLV